MSLVERALKKLQESRASIPESPGYSPEAVVPPDATSPILQRPAAPSQERQASAAAPPGDFTAPTRIVTIDKNVLRAMELAPPAMFERQIASQYQHIKRPLVLGALGRSNPPVANGHLIMLASAVPGEGKTFTSINLALSMALEKDIEVLLVDADVAKPHISRIFGLQAEPGLLDLLGNGALHPRSFILPTNVPGLSILPAGRQVDNATELLSSARMEEVVGQLRTADGRRIVLFDSPPLLLSTESRAVAAVVGQVVLVVRAQFTPRSAVMDAIELIGEDKPLSLILNQSDSMPTEGYYGYGSYGDAVPEAAG